MFEFNVGPMEIEASYEQFLPSYTFTMLPGCDKKICDVKYRVTSSGFTSEYCAETLNALLAHSADKSKYIIETIDTDFKG